MIDVGIGPRAIGERLESVGATWSRIAAVVLTHTHGDHVDTKAFAELARRGVVLHCHEAHRAVLAADPGFGKLEEARLIRLYDDRPFLTSTGLRLEPIELRHDGGPTFGFRIEASTGRRQRPVSIGYLADTGSWSESMAESLADVDVLGVEFNHDVALQKSSPRPAFLIERNLSDHGHLSNRQGAELIQAVLARSRDGVIAARGLAPPERTVQSTRSGDPGRGQTRSAPRGASSRFMPRGRARLFPTSGSGPAPAGPVPPRSPVEQRAQRERETTWSTARSRCV